MSNAEQILTVSVEARINRLEREMKKASTVVGRNFNDIEQRSGRAATRMESQWSAMGTRFAAIGRSLATGMIGGFVALGVTGLVREVGQVARGIAEIGDEAARSGMRLDEFQQWRFVAEQNRVGVDALVDGIKELQLRADEFVITGGGSAAEAFGRLGYTADNLAIALQDPSRLFTEIIGKLGRLDRAAQIRIADEIFGGTGGERFVQLIELGEQGLLDARQEAVDLGLVLSQDVVDAADELDRRFNAIAATVGTALKGAIVEAATALATFIDQFNGFMASWSGETGPGAGLNGSQQWSDLLTPDQRNQLRLDLNLASIRGGPDADPYAGFSFGDNGNIVIAPPVAPAAPDVPSASAGGGGGARSAATMREQRDAAAELIIELQEELRLLGESEIEQRVNAELRRAGAGATDDQQASIRDLVTSIETEQAAMDRLAEAAENAQGVAKEFLGGLLTDLRSGVDGATALTTAFGRLGDKLLDLALDTVLTILFENLTAGAGAGLLGNLFGFSQGGVVEAATGGLIRGAGTGTSDSIPARLSNGEFVVRASETSKHLDLLRAINAGQVPAFATGGLVGEASALAANGNRLAANSNAPSVTINAPVTVNANGGSPDQNQDLASKVSRELEGTMRGLISDELRRATRPGNLMASRAR